MLVLKYAKTDFAKYISHIDTLRLLQRTLRRAKIPVKYSEGFHPHMLLKLSSPLPVGIESVTEFVEIDTAAPKDNFIFLFNKYCPEGIKAIKIWDTVATPKIVANTIAAEYTAETDIFDKDAVTCAFSDKVYAFTAKKGRLTFTLACGNDNLRPDRFLESLAVKHKIADGDFSFCIKVIRTKLYTGRIGDLIFMDDFLDKLKRV
jgi:hypothetical protein